MHLITAPEPLSSAPAHLPVIFLAGAIDQGRAEAWQAQVAAAFANDQVVLLNPRRLAWDATWPQDPADPRFRGQVEWELEGLAQATLIMLYLPATSQAPISLLELGLFAASGKLLVGCERPFWRYGNVAIVCERYDIPLFTTLEALIAATRQRLSG